VITDSLQNELVDRLWAAVSSTAPGPVSVCGPVTLDSAYAVGEFAAASVAVAGLAAARLTGGETRVDRALTAEWFRSAVTLRDAPPVSVWDAIAGDYPTVDGWIRLHTNAPHHRAAALGVLGTGNERDAVANAVAAWHGEALEAAIVVAGGCAAVMRTRDEWMRHPQGVAVTAEPLVAWRGGAEQRDGEGVGSEASRGGAGGIRGARVLDLTRVIAGPVATRLLAGLGADVLRVDPPGWEEPALVHDMTLGKRCARLDLKTDGGLAALRELAASADIVVHGYRADALEKLGLDFGELRPGVVDVAIDAYGWSGPWRNRRGYDSLVQMSIGIAEEGMRWFGREAPTPLPVQALDHATGYLAAAAALEGLARRRDTGCGSSARLSLARTGIELAGLGRGGAAEPERAVGGETMPTHWGEARVLGAPVTIGGVAPAWPTGPRPLGADEPVWA
jgi:hypothetical protein